MLVRDIMSRPVTVGADTPVREVARLMLRRGVGSVVVVGDKGEPRGIITERDFTEHGELPYSERGGPTVLRIGLSARNASEAFSDARTSLAHRIMRPLDAALEEGDPLEKALDLMQHRGKKNVVVMRDGRAVGIVSHHDFLRLAARETAASRSGRALELV